MDCCSVAHNVCVLTVLIDSGIVVELIALLLKVFVLINCVCEGVIIITYPIEILFNKLFYQLKLAYLMHLL